MVLDSSEIIPTLKSSERDEFIALSLHSKGDFATLKMLNSTEKGNTEQLENVDNQYIEKNLPNYLLHTIKLKESPTRTSYEEFEKILQKQVLIAQELFSRGMAGQALKILKRAKNAAYKKECLDVILFVSSVIHRIEVSLGDRSGTEAYMNELQSLSSAKIWLEQEVNCVKKYLDGQEGLMDLPCMSGETDHFSVISTIQYGLSKIKECLAHMKNKNPSGLKSSLIKLNSLFQNEKQFPTRIYDLVLKLNALVSINIPGSMRNEIVLHKLRHRNGRKWRYFELRFLHAGSNKRELKKLLKNLNTTEKDANFILMEAIILFEGGQFKQCLDYLEASFYQLKIEKPTYFGTKLLQLLCQIELGRHYLVEYGLQNYRKYVLANKDSMTEIYHNILMVLEGMMRSNYSFSNLKKKSVDYGLALENLCPQADFFQPQLPLFKHWLQSKLTASAKC